MEIVRASAGDAEEILALQRAAYRSEAALYDDYRIPPLVETTEELRGRFRDHIILKAVSRGDILGSVGACEAGGTCFIGRLVVAPEARGRGLGTRLMREIESRFPGSRGFELFTGHLSEGNLRLYRKLGYEGFREERVSAPLTLVYLRKGGGPVAACAPDD